ncbi:MAG: hypothetical protein WAM22_11560 [Nitrososphaeraceae archaeon]
MLSNSCAIIISAVASSSKTNKVLLLFVQQHLSKTSIQDFNPRLQSHAADTTSTA